MESFNYLSVLISIILGLAIAQVLQGVRGLVLTRSKVKLYTPTVIWTGMALLIAIQGWWASFSMHQQARWNFLGLLTIVLQATTVYMIAALILPDAKGDKTVDLREHYFAHRHWFFGAVLSSVVFSLLKELVLYDRLPHPLNLGFQVAFGAIAIIAMLLRREWLHKLLAPVSALLFLLYIALIFRNLHQ
ncbi:MAG: hypothetical protein JOZ31_08705 [Verrucomicrobia bacterium]|nr:hypothetical protein [Verrucomicrobiota bacterium]